MTNIALNARFYAHRPTGMQRYALELSRRFAGVMEPLYPARSLRGTAGHLWEQFCLPSAVRGRLLWSPNNTGPLAVERQVCTIHDLIPLDHPEWFQPSFVQWYRWLLPRLARRVRHIIAVSEFTMQRIMELLRVPAGKITVIPNGVDRRFSPSEAWEIEHARHVLRISSPHYLLCVGSLEPRKNLSGLLEAWRRVQSRVPAEVELVVAGAPGNSRVFGSVSTDSLPPRVHFTGYVADEFLPALYSGALALLYPSLYEGFGLPPLEAMACGAPTVTSNGTSLPEVVGDAAILVDPYDPDSIADGILRVLSSSGLRDELREKARARAASLTWEKTAQQTLGLLLQQSGI
jgi:glycosyltransferase involved in cell wall biosynthesis